ncbi:MAG: hypothetical protein R2795_17000 [Saprospiraceae bacterium]
MSFALILVICIGCGNWSSKISDSEKAYNFVLTTIVSDFEQEKNFVALLPEKGKKKKVYPQNGKIYIEYRISYPDNSVFYISNDIWNGSRLNVENLIVIGVNGHTKEVPMDTVSYSGGEGKFWKEQFIGDIVIGYVNASPLMKNKFENAITSLQIKGN